MIIAITRDRKEKTIMVDYPDSRLTRDEYEKRCLEQEFPCEVLAYIKVNFERSESEAIAAFRMVCIDGSEELREVLDMIVHSVYESKQS